jgi:TonB family protein
MALILLAEEETSTIDHVRSVLASQGWLVKTVKSRAQALRAASEFAPQLVLLNDELKGVDDLVRTFSRRSGGPGVVLLSTKEESPSDGEDVEAVLTKPIETEDLIETIRTKLSTATDKKASSDADTDVRIFSSEEIFGDLLDDILDKDEAKQAVSSADEDSAEEPAAEEVAAETEDSETDTPEEIELEDLGPAEAVGEVETSAAEDEPEPEPTDEKEEEEDTAAVSDADSMADFSDLEELAKEAVPAFVDAMEAQARQEGAPEEELDVAELLRETAPTPAPAEPEATPTGEDSDADLEAKLSDTLAGVLAASLGAAAEPKSTEADRDSGSANDVDSLLSQALGDLDIGEPRAPEGPVTTLDADTREASSEELEAGEEAVAEEESEEAEEADVMEVSEPEAEDETPVEEVAEPVADEETEPVIEFGEYSLEERIGLGGMAEVWKARRQGVEGFEKRVAIKKILPQPAENQDFVDMFIDEAKLAAQLNHKNITHIYDLGKVDDDYFIAMEYVAGENLRRLLDAGRKREKPLPAGLALYIASRIADALDYAHRSKDFNNTELGLVHRDVSPHNVLISHEGDIKLCDFGIAKAVSKISTTQMGALKGKLQYMSPEQAWGRSIDHRSDIFSTGTLLFEMLTGEKLFTGDSELAVLEAVRECETAERVIQDPAIPSRIKGLLLRALAKETEERYETAGELLGGLEELLEEFEPTPGQREMSAYVHELLDLPEDTAKESGGEPEEAKASKEAEPEVEEETSEPAAILLDEAPVEPAGEETADEDAVEEEKKRPAFLKWLSRLLPVVAVAAVGGYLIAGRSDGPRVTQPSGETATPRVVESPVFRPDAVEASLPSETGGGESATPAGGEAAQATAPTPVQAQPTPAPAPQNQQVDEPAQEPEPAAEDTSTDAEPIPTEVAESVTQQEPGANPSDPELDRRVEEDLQRVQELISTPDFAADGEQGTTAPTESLSGEIEPTTTVQDPAVDDFGTLIEEAGSSSTAQEVANDSSQGASLVGEEPATSVPDSEGFEEGPTLTAEGGDPPEDTIPAAEPEVADSSPALPIAPPAEEPAATQPGDLVEPGPGVVEPQVLSFQPPAYSEVARRVRATCTVRVAVLVDENGQVADARLVEGLPQRVGLDEQTLEAARRATFRAATKDGVPVKMWHELAVQFQP